MENIIHLFLDETSFFPHSPLLSHLPQPGMCCKCPLLRVRCGRRKMTGPQRWLWWESEVLLPRGAGSSQRGSLPLEGLLHWRGSPYWFIAGCELARFERTCHTWVRARTHTHLYTHMCAHTHILTLYMHTHTLMHTYPLTLMLTHILTHTHTLFSVFRGLPKVSV